MPELISSKLCTSDFVVWPQYTFGLSLFVVSIRRFSLSVDETLDSVASSMPSNNAVVQTDARDPTDVLANMVRTVAAGTDVPAQVVVVPSPLPATCRISVKRTFRSSPPSPLLHSCLLSSALNCIHFGQVQLKKKEEKRNFKNLRKTLLPHHVSSYL